MAVRVCHSFPAVAEQIGPWRNVAETLLRTWTGEEVLTQHVHELLLAMQEAVTNVIRHAYHGIDSVDGHEPRIDVEFRFEGDCVEVLVKDWGHPFDPDSVPEPNFEDPTPGGYGVYIMKSVTDGFEYRREGTCNVLCVRKYLPGRETAECAP